MPDRFSEKGNARQGFFERHEFLAILPFLPAPLDDAARFAFATGWRRGEVLPLRWASVYGDEIRLGTTKNGEGASTPINSGLREIIERQRARREFQTPAGPALSAYVFHRNGKPVNKSTFKKQWRRAAVKAGLARMVPREDGKLDKKGRPVMRYAGGKMFHDFRRTATRNLIRGGVPQSVAMRVTHHKTASVFTRYDITNSKDKLAALEAAAAFVEQQPETAVENVVAFARKG